MIRQEDINRVMAATAYDVDGKKIGDVGQVYLDDRSGNPAWVTVRTGLLGGHDSFVPLVATSIGSRGDLQLPFGKSKIKHAPSITPGRPDGGLTAAQERELYQYYELQYDEAGTGQSSAALGATGGPGPSGQPDIRGARYDETTGRGLPDRAATECRTDDLTAEPEERLDLDPDRPGAGIARPRSYVDDAGDYVDTDPDSRINDQDGGRRTDPGRLS